MHATAHRCSFMRLHTGVHACDCTQVFMHATAHRCSCTRLHTGVHACDCTQVFMHVTAHKGWMNTVRESALKVDSRRKKPLLHRGIEPASTACLSDALPTELHPTPFPLNGSNLPRVHEICSLCYGMNTDFPNAPGKEYLFQASAVQMVTQQLFYAFFSDMHPSRHHSWLCVHVARDSLRGYDHFSEAISFEVSSIWTRLSWCKGYSYSECEWGSFFFFLRMMREGATVTRLENFPS